MADKEQIIQADREAAAEAMGIVRLPDGRWYCEKPLNEATLTEAFMHHRLAHTPPAKPEGLRCDVESNLTGCLHPEEHKGSCGYSLPHPIAEAGSVEKLSGKTTFDKRCDQITRDAIRDSLARIEAAFGTLFSDRDEWRDQHENLLSVRQSDLEALSATPPAPADVVEKRDRELYARTVEGDSDNPLRVAKANAVIDGIHDDEVRLYALHADLVEWVKTIVDKWAPRDGIVIDGKVLSEADISAVRHIALNVGIAASRSAIQRPAQVDREVHRDATIAAAEKRGLERAAELVDNSKDLNPELASVFSYLADAIRALK